LAHWTFTQRSIRVVLANKSSLLKQKKRILAETVGDAIRAARKQAGLTQQKLAEMTGIHRQWLGRWERGRDLPPSKEWTRLNSILKCHS
jgi:ribosome-binding protein aMBF1 (putative translation factor)